MNPSQKLKQLQKQNPAITELIKRFKLIPLRVSPISNVSKDEKVNEVKTPQSDTK